MAGELKGECLCGAVTITATTHEHATSACHCSMCRRWSGGPQWGFDAPADAVTVLGDVRTYRSTTFSERAFCPVCGSHLWLRDDGGAYEFVPGLFDGASDMPLVREVYSDRAFACARFSGDHDRITKAEYEAEHSFQEDDA